MRQMEHRVCPCWLLRLIVGSYATAVTHTCCRGPVGIKASSGLRLVHKTSNHSSRYFLSTDKYIYADASMAPKTDFPLRYTTRPFVPRMKCLNFWYHMNGSGVGLLSVTVHQDSSLHKEVFRLHGNQGNAWRVASVPLDTSLNTSAGFFEVKLAFDHIMVTPSPLRKFSTETKKTEINVW